MKNFTKYITYRGTNREQKKKTLKFSIPNQVPANSIHRNGYTWMQEYVLKFCRYENF